ncbi:MAG: Ig-like domain-containing protein [Chitinophagales bacterium]
MDIPAGVILEVTDDNTTITVTPEDGFEGCVVFSYIVCDSNELCDTAEVAVAVGDVDCLNQMPIAVDDGYTTPQGEAIGFDVLENDSDPDGDILTATPITDPANGMLIQEEDGTFTYIPNADFVGTDYFMYIACDDATMPPLCDTAAVVITILPQEGDPVVANPDISQTGMDTPIEIPVLDNDEGDDLTVNEIVIDPENGTVTTDGTTVTYTPDEGFVGTDYFIYEACNNTGQCDTTLVTVIVLPDSITNVPPVAVNDVATTPENTPVEIPVLVNDFDPYGGDTIVITAFDPPLNGTALFDDNGVFTYTPSPDFIGIDSFTYTICDNGTPVLCDTATVVINVGSDELPNNPPVAVDDEVTTPPDTPINIPILGNDSDPDGDNLVVTFISVPGHGTAELVDGEVVFTPEESYVGDDFFSYVICDDGTPVLCDTAYVTVHIMDEVVDNIIDITVTENSDNTLCLDSLIASNILTLDFDPESISITTLPSNGTASPSDIDNTCFAYAPETDFTGVDQLILEVCNGEDCEIVTVNINVIPLDGIVVIAEDDETTTDINTPIDIPVLGNDAYPTDDSGVIVLTILEGPSNGTVLVNGDILGDTTITYTPDTDFAAIDSFQYVLCYTFPDTAICDTALVIVTIDAENNPCEPEFANAFSPNGDNINDLFLIQNADNLEECFDAIGELVIFNRWGDEVYRIDGYDNSVAWDGTWQNNGNDVPDGTYFYILQYSANDRPVTHNGFVEVCR